MHHEGSMESTLHSLNYLRHLLVTFFALGCISKSLPGHDHIGAGVLEVHPAHPGGSAICKLRLVNNLGGVFPEELEGLEEADLS